MTDKPQFQPLNIAVLTVSDSRSLKDDKSGDYLEKAIVEDGHNLVARSICRDDKYEIRKVVSDWILDTKVEVIITTGGTGLTGRDGTPEAMVVLFDKVIDGFGELFRMRSWENIKTSTVQSRALGGVANGTYCFVLPGSTGACKDAWQQILVHQLDIRHRPCNFAELMPRLLEK